MKKIEIGSLVKVNLSNGNFHIGEYLGEDKLFEDTHKIGIKSTSIPGVSLKPRKKYISVFRTSIKKIKTL